MPKEPNAKTRRHNEEPQPPEIDTKDSTVYINNKEVEKGVPSSRNKENTSSIHRSL